MFRFSFGIYLMAGIAALCLSIIVGMAIGIFVLDPYRKRHNQPLQWSTSDDKTFIIIPILVFIALAIAVGIHGHSEAIKEQEYAQVKADYPKSIGKIEHMWSAEVGHDADIQFLTPDGKRCYAKLRNIDDRLQLYDAGCDSAPNKFVDGNG